MAKMHLTLEDLAPTAEEAKENGYIAHARAELVRLQQQAMQADRAKRINRGIFFVLLVANILLLAYDATLFN